MSFILHIDTAGETGMVCLSQNGNLVSKIENDNQKEHASFLHVAIDSLLKNTSVEIKNLAAIAVTEGPGSYTGLRVGLSTAKGLCFALNIPLITLNTLELLAHASVSKEDDPQTLYWPMIDARRMEVFTALYKKDLSLVLLPQAMILEKEVLETYLSKSFIIFSGSRISKLTGFIQSSNMKIITPNTALSFCLMSFNKLEKQIFSDLFYAEPLYIKEFQDSRR